MSKNLYTLQNESATVSNAGITSCAANIAAFNYYMSSRFFENERKGICPHF